MKVSRREVENFLLAFPQFAKRSLMYVSAVEFAKRKLGTSEATPEMAQVIILSHRRLQDILPNDEKGKKLEAEFRDDMGMKDIVSFAEEALTPPGYVRLNGHLMKIVR